MDEKKQYKCRKCGNIVDAGAEREPAPICCDDPMDIELSVCTTSDTAEHSRFEQIDEPCDDGRSGKI